MNARYSIRAVAKETGLSVHAIRAWERRYGILEPARTGTNRRVYGEEDVNRLKLLHRAVQSGHSIGLIAPLSNDELQKLVGAPSRSTVDIVRSDQFLDECCQAVQEMNAEKLDSELLRGSSVLGVDRFLQELILPLISVVDEEWSQNRLSIAQEHLVTALVKTHLERLRLSMGSVVEAPAIVVATPVSQHHELGAMLAAIVAARSGWGVTYLGPNLPASEIALAARRTGAAAVALSIVFPEADPRLESELSELRSLLEPGVSLVVGGRAAQSYASVLTAHQAVMCSDLDRFDSALAEIRRFGRK